MTGLLDTIFARASGPGRGAVTVVRISGARAGGVLRRLAGRVPPPRLATLRRLAWPSGEDELDRALLLWFPAPHSYTGEDVAELHIHGGTAVFEAVGAALRALGCRPADPGEFTRRAFLHGKLDLLQAEAIGDLISAETDAQRRQALRQAGGALSALYEGWTGRLTRILAQQEAAIEFEMDDLPTDLPQLARAAAAGLRGEIAAHLQDGGRGEKLRDGLTIAIAGAPNVGKSSLLNALAGRAAAIVSAQAGTTRDVIEVPLDLAGIPVLLCDMAGLRRTTDEVEQEGIRRARARIAEAELVLVLVAADAGPDEEARAALEMRPDALVIATKHDLAPGRDDLPVNKAVSLWTSAKTGRGIEELRGLLSTEAKRLAGLTEEPSLTRARHRAALDTAVHWLAVADTGDLPEVVAECYRSALRNLGELTGRGDVESVLDSIFSEFCIGK
jgi:tRNA modification GTPase